MGTSLVAHCAELIPVYALIVRRMKVVGLEWRYVHPRLPLGELSGLHERLGRGHAPEWPATSSCAAAQSPSSTTSPGTQYCGGEKRAGPR
jgi:hypothetical protein